MEGDLGSHSHWWTKSPGHDPIHPKVSSYPTTAYAGEWLYILKVLWGLPSFRVPVVELKASMKPHSRPATPLSFITIYFLEYQTKNKWKYQNCCYFYYIEFKKKKSKFGSTSQSSGTWLAWSRPKVHSSARREEEKGEGRGEKEKNTMYNCLYQ